jgi:hypothetical protein
MDCHEVSEIGNVMIWQKQHSRDNILKKHFDFAPQESRRRIVCSIPIQARKNEKVGNAVDEDNETMR